MSTEIPNALKSLERFKMLRSSAQPPGWALFEADDGDWIRLSDVAQALQPEPGEVVVKLTREEASNIRLTCAAVGSGGGVDGNGTESPIYLSVADKLRSALEESS